MQLHKLTINKIKNKSRRRVGRGIGSGRGKTAGRGTKGQKSRTGGNIPANFAGGQKPLMQIIPKKRGFHRPNKPRVLIINLRDLSRWASGNKLNLQTIQESRSMDNYNAIKILGVGEVKEAFEIEVHGVSVLAKQKIEQAGGKINLIR